jgi:hypothetical protein
MIPRNVIFKSYRVNPIINIGWVARKMGSYPQTIVRSQLAALGIVRLLGVALIWIRHLRLLTAFVALFRTKNKLATKINEPAIRTPHQAASKLEDFIK